jgi:inner membrane protein
MEDTQQTTIRFAIIGALMLAMIIPMALVEGVTDDRQNYFDQTFRDIATTWGGSQDIVGPFLIIPEQHRRTTVNESGELVSESWRHHRIVLPDELEIDAHINHQFRQRAIYDVPVYLADLQLRGSFRPLETVFDEQPHIEVLLNEAVVVVGISHTQAISSASALTFADASTDFTSGTGHKWLGSGISANVTGLSRNERLPFSFDMSIKGTEHLGFMPLGSASRIQMTATWPHPSFGGHYLPDRHDITPNGFEASWQVHELARDLPATWLDAAQKPDLSSGFARVGLFQPVTDYRTVDRAIKYGLLFVALTYLSFICFELTLSIRFHPVQYGVVGIGLTLFYLALLSLSEHIAFGWSFLSATALLTTLIAGYVWAMTERAALVAWSGSVVATLYATLYVLLQLETFALLVGTSMLFAGLIALMYATRSLSETVDPDERPSMQPIAPAPEASS